MTRNETDKKRNACARARMCVCVYVCVSERRCEKERRRGRERKKRENIYKHDIKKKKQYINYIAWYEQNCDILLYNFTEGMREI